MGISVDEFWKMSPKKMYIRRLAYEKSMEIEYERVSYESWLNGYFMCHAIMSTIGNAFSKNQKHEYPDNPLKKKEVEKELTLNERKQQFYDYFAQFECFKKK